MILSAETRSILEQVERQTGRPAHLLLEPNLPTLAKVTMAAAKLKRTAPTLHATPPRDERD